MRGRQFIVGSDSGSHLLSDAPPEWEGVFGGPSADETRPRGSASERNVAGPFQRGAGGPCNGTWRGPCNVAVSAMWRLQACRAGRSLVPDLRQLQTATSSVRPKTAVKDGCQRPKHI